MRLTDYEIESIKKTFYKVFGEGRIYLFGSRVDDSKRGGDIDLYMELSSEMDIKKQLDKKSEFKIKLYDIIGEQKIDIIISKDKNRSIEKEAMKKGVLL